MTDLMKTIGKITKGTIDDIAERVVTDLLDTYESKDAIGILYSAKEAMDESYALLKERVKADFNAVPEVSRNGLKIQTIPQVKYDYSHDVIWKEYTARIEAFTELRKQREIFLRNLTQPVADMETGEEILPARVVKNDYTLKVSIPKA